MNQSSSEAMIFEEKNIWKILFHIAPPVMLAQLIQAMYNIVDSFFVGKYSGYGLTALSIIFPIQLIIIAIAVGTGVGVNILMPRYYAKGESEMANKAAGTGTVLAVISWLLFAFASTIFLQPYVMISAESDTAVKYAMTYGNIICIGSLGLFLESIWTKVHQAKGNMRLPMIAQITGAIVNIILDPILIFGIGPVTAFGVEGAGYATVIGQITAACITISGFRRPPCVLDICYFAKKIYNLGYPAIFMQLLYTIYMMVLNIILAGFSDAAVTVLGLYYKVQSFFFIPLYGLQTCIGPLISYTFSKESYQRCHQIIINSITLSMAFMLLGVGAFELIPRQLIGVFSADMTVIDIGETAFRIIGISFVPAVLSLMTPVFFQAIGNATASVLLSITRQIFCLIPLFWLFSLLGLQYTWVAFPLAETITGALGMMLYRRQLRKWNILS